MNFFQRLSGDTAWAIFIVGFFLAGFLEFPLVTMGAGLIYFLLSGATGHNPGRNIAGMLPSGAVGGYATRLPPVVNLRNQSTALLVGIDTLYFEIHAHNNATVAPLIGFRAKRFLPRLIARSGMKLAKEQSTILANNCAASLHVHISFEKNGQLVGVVVQVEVEGIVFADRGSQSEVKDICTLWSNYAQTFTVSEQIPAEVERTIFFQLDTLSQLCGMGNYQTALTRRSHSKPGGGRR